MSDEGDAPRYPIPQEWDAVARGMGITDLREQLDAIRASATAPLLGTATDVVVPEHVREAVRKAIAAAIPPAPQLYYTHPDNVRRIAAHSADDDPVKAITDALEAMRRKLPVVVYPPEHEAAVFAAADAHGIPRSCLRRSTRTDGQVYVMRPHLLGFADLRDVDPADANVVRASMVYSPATDQELDVMGIPLEVDDTLEPNVAELRDSSGATVARITVTDERPDA